MLQDLTALQVQNENGEIEYFPLTRCGIYKLAKLLSRYYNVDPNEPLHTLLGRNTMVFDLIPQADMQRIRKSLQEHGIYRPQEARWLYIDDALFKNIKLCSDGRFHFISDVFSLPHSSYMFPNSWKKYLSRCDDCGAIFFDQKLIEDDEKMSIISSIDCRLIGYDGYCNRCLPCNLHQCSDCGRIFDENDEDYAVVRGDYICDDCLHNGDYYCCDYCGEWFHSDDGVFVDNGGCYCSDDCCESDGNHWSDYRDCWVRDDDYDDNEYRIDEIIPDYHDSPVETYFNGGIKKGAKHWLGIGTETEVDGKSRYDFSYEYYENLWDMFGGEEKCFFERDGSVEFEIISQPMTEEEFFNYDWKTPFDKLVKDGWRSHDTDTCGRHFHFSKWYLGSTPNQIRNSAKKICRFFQLYADDIVKIARRGFNHYTRDLNELPEIDKNFPFRKLRGDRYWAVNCSNLGNDEIKGTIEIRICKGTLNAETTLASADFFLHLVRNAKRISWKNIDNLKLWFKGIKRKETIDYIKSRHAFEGEF